MIERIDFQGVLTHVYGIFCEYIREIIFFFVEVHKLVNSSFTQTKLVLFQNFYRFLSLFFCICIPCNKIKKDIKITTSICVLRFMSARVRLIDVVRGRFSNFFYVLFLLFFLPCS